MSEPEKAPRFPFVAAALCAACVGAAAWTWMRYSYAWDVTVKRLMAGDASCPASSLEQLEIGRWIGVYVRVRDFVAYKQRMAELWGFSSGGLTHRPAYVIPVADRENPQIVLNLALSRHDEILLLNGHGVFTGRVVISQSGSTWPIWLVDTTASRFTGASIAGLIVGAMGVFVFAFFLVRWLRRRRAAA